MIPLLVVSGLVVLEIGVIGFFIIKHLRAHGINCSIYFPTINVPPIEIPPITIPAPQVEMGLVEIPPIEIPPISLNIQWPSGAPVPNMIQLLRKENDQWVSYASLRKDDTRVQIALDTPGLAIKHGDGTIEEGVQ